LTNFDRLRPGKCA